MTAVRLPVPSRQATPPAASACALDVHGARVSIGDASILHGVDVHVPAGRTLALLGPSGCGKTTLLRAIAGLQPLQEGAVRIADEDVTRVKPERRGVGLVFQDGALFPHMTVGGNVAFGLSRGARRRQRVEDALELVGLGGFGSRMPSTLSGGQQQRVALARALVTEPRVILLDEPFSALDASLRTQVRTDVAALLRRLSITTVVVTHDQEEAFVLGDEVAVMFDGEVHQQGRPTDVYDDPATPEVAHFVGDANMLSATALGDHAECAVGLVPLRTPGLGATRVLLRPEHLLMSAGGDAEVTGIEFYGHDAVCSLVTASGELRVRTMSAPPVEIGDSVGLRYVGPPAASYAA